ncbi:MAG: hypothetical protein HY223_00190 [Thaumarchaeota archaeon]|nr:hypothetical protein [Nitrososphaerota archaeon]
MPRMKKIEYIKKFVSSLKNGNLPWKLRLYISYPKNCPYCHEFHSDITIEKYNNKNQRFTCTHQSGMVPVFHNQKELEDLIADTVRRRVLSLKDLRKEFNLSKFMRIKFIGFRISEHEEKSLRELAKSKDMTLSEYVRKKVLAD